MYSNIIIILLILQDVWIIQGRTPEDVIQDFEPAFQQIHEEFYQMEDNVHYEVQPLSDKVSEAIFKENEYLNETLNLARRIIQESVWQTLEDIGMSNDLDLISHCIKSLNKSEATLIASAFGGTRICIKTTLGSFTESQEYIKQLFSAFEGEHSILEATREECGKITVPFDVQTCLINDLYITYPSYLKDVKPEVNPRVEKYKEMMEHITVQLDKCDKYVLENIKEDYTEMLNDFEKCVAYAKPF